MSDPRITCRKCNKVDAPASLARTFTAFDNAVILHFAPDHICAECTWEIVKAIGDLCNGETMGVVTTEDQHEVERLLHQCGIDMS